ncbi:MAG: hypothetical protein KBT63_06530 [Porticoccaceae bacterium]|nr:hypothetical protein [Porticoccaceae bacterium]
MYKIKELEAEYLESDEINVVLPIKESVFLKTLIESWYSLSKHRNFPMIIGCVVKQFYKANFFMKMRKAFKTYPNACEIFRFYILYKGKEVLYINANTDENDKNSKIIKIFKLWHA